MRFSTQEEGFEYRMKSVVGEVLSELEVQPENLTPDELDKLLWDNTELLGQRLYENMNTWMSAEDWLKLLKGE